MHFNVLQIMEKSFLLMCVLSLCVSVRVSYVCVLCDVYVCMCMRVYACVCVCVCVYTYGHTPHTQSSGTGLTETKLLLLSIGMCVGRSQCICGASFVLSFTSLCGDALHQRCFR